MTSIRKSLIGLYQPESVVDWDIIYAELLPRVYNFFLYRVNDDSLAEDLTATTFERAWRSRKKYSRDLSRFSTWLFSIARHVLGDYRRHAKLILPLQDDHPADDTDAIEDGLEKQDNITRLMFLLSQVPERDQELVALKYGAGLTNREIARVTGLSESNVGTILNRIVNKLRLQWEQTS